ncbi:uncharacterized protein LOC116289927 [Actinia tenebrosa]|uniref:Uncharacterized protein LOC116289927 n=1 Tax=Actinia tenebrosa TaxID=6105 RepID=A0A6P8HC82_ACTTE|nr:uncharacterized protein LOC116289927 [Actinia tenebrosa]
MLPSLQSSTKAISTDEPREKKAKKYRRKTEKSKKKPQGKCSFLPDINQGYLNSSQWEERIIESRSMRPSKTRVKQRGGGFREYINPNLPDTTSYGGYGNLRKIASFKTSDLPLDSLGGKNRGWSLQNPNPRLMNLQRLTGRFQKDEPFAYGDIFEYKSTKTVAKPHIEFLYQRRLSNSREHPTFIGTNGSVATLHDRFHCPPINASHSNTADHLPSTKTATSIPSSLPSVMDEGCCVHRKACTCDRRAEEKNNPPPRDVFKRWERSSRSVVSETSMHSSSGSSFCDQNGESNGNSWINNRPSFPKTTKKKPSGLSLENARKTMKKIVPLRTDSQEKLYDKRRRSTHTTSNISIDKKSKHKMKVQPEESSSTNDVSKEEIKTKNEETESKEEKCVEPDPLLDKTSVEMEVELISIEDNDKNYDVISEVENETMVTIPCNARRVVTPKLLQIQSDGLKDDDEFSTLRKMFTKLDNDGDGHLSFSELRRSLPSDLTKRQLDYLKKIYAMACESTFFGFEEFVAVHQMCDVIAHVKNSVFKGFESVNIDDIEDSLPTYLDLFNTLDENQTGSIDAAMLKELLASTLNVPKKSDVIEATLEAIGKTNGNMISKVELLAFLPFFVSISSS